MHSPNSDRAQDNRPGKAKGRANRAARVEHGQRGPRPQSGRVSQPKHREDLYAEVTRRIIAELAEGRVPWVQPWGKAGAAAATLPRNALTDRPYSGINILLLWGAVIDQGYPAQSWLTFRQAVQAGGAVRKGERGTPVVYADRFTPSAERERARESGEDAKAIAFLKRFTVFNVAQIDGLPDGFGADPAPLPERQIIPVAEAVIAASGVPFRIGGERAFYVPSLDFVQVPPQPAFFEQVNYYRTCLHELTHATGHASRLNRTLATTFGSKDYAREELVAELGSAFLCAALGITPTVRHADYMAGWLDLLHADSKAIFRAASAASKAADWLLARHREPLGAVAEADPAGGGNGAPDAPAFLPLPSCAPHDG